MIENLSSLITEKLREIPHLTIKEIDTIYLMARQAKQVLEGEGKMIVYGRYDSFHLTPDMVTNDNDYVYWAVVNFSLRSQEKEAYTRMFKSLSEYLMTRGN